MKYTKLKFTYSVLVLWIVIFCGSVLSESNEYIRLEVKLEEYELAYPWYEEREDGFDDGVAPLAKFKIIKPDIYSSREVSVLFNSQHYETLLTLMEKRVGLVFLIDAPADFLEGNSRIIDAMYIRTIELKNPCKSLQ